MKQNLLSILLLFAGLSCAFAQKTVGPVMTYRNPVIAGDFADPSVIRVGDTFYAVGTSSEWGPAYPIYTSKNLVNWEYVGPVFNDLPGWTMGSFWAPELYFKNGTFYCYYTARRKSDKKSFIGVATSKDITRGFKDQGVLIEWTDEAIDAFVVEDQGKLYITWKAYGLDKGKSIELLGAELSADGLKLKGKAFTMLTADATGWESGGMEGQSVFKRGNYWYMLYSGNACCGEQCDYQVGFARAEKLQGPWQKYAGNPVLFGDDSWKCPGHGTVVTTADKRYFYLHHAYNAIDFTFGGRQGVLTELVWDEVTKWPLFRYGKTVPLQAEAPYGVKPVKNDNFSVDYERDTLQLPWVYDVAFPKPKYTLKYGSLEIENTNHALTGNFLGLVVQKGDYTFSAEVGLSGLAQQIVLYGDAQNALGFGVRQNVLELWQLRDGKKEVIKTQDIPDRYQVVELKLRSKFGRYYEFSWGVKGQRVDSLTSAVQLEAPWLPRWDRAPRVGVNVTGDEPGHSDIRMVKMRYE